jgi:AcrR family transcriptional regulator
MRCMEVSSRKNPDRADTGVSTRPSRGRPRLDAQTCARVLEFALSEPGSGQDRIARQLQSIGVSVSASGVRQVLERHGLQTRARRVARIEAASTAGRSVAHPVSVAAEDPVRTQGVELGADVRSARARPARAAANRESHILSVAARLIRERGFDAISLRDIAEAAGLPPGSLYYHFPTKELLFTSVYEEGIRRLQASVQEALGRSTDPWSRVEKACAAHLSNLCGGDDFTAVSIPTRVPVLSPPARRTVQDLNDGYEQLFRKLVQELPLRRGVSRTLLRLQLLGALNWTSVWYRPGGATTVQVAQHLIRVLRLGAQVVSQAGRATG